MPYTPDNGNSLMSLQVPYTINGTSLAILTAVHFHCKDIIIKNGTWPIMLKIF